MRAMAIPSYGPVEQMKLIELPTPEPGPGQVRVKNRADDLALLGRWLNEGLKVPIDSMVPVRDVVAGIKRLAAGEMRGRISVDVIGGF